jgi:DNA-binding NtrC family response regulator
MEPIDIDTAALSILARRNWPGNVRELLNYVRRLVVFSSGKCITASLIHPVEGKSGTGIIPETRGLPLYRDAKKEVLDLFAKNYLTRLFEQTKGNISKVSRLSGLERASIQKIIKRLNIDISEFRT